MDQADEHEFSFRKTADILNELKGQTDRGLALVGATIAQEQLKGFILTRFVRRSKKICGMFGPDGAMGAFGSQIKLAHAMGLISTVIYNDLNLIREIRNKFAHYIHFSDKDTEPGVLVTFSHKIIHNWAMSLACPATAARVPDPRKRFAITCNQLQCLLYDAKTNADIAIPVEYSAPNDDLSRFGGLSDFY